MPKPKKAPLLILVGGLTGAGKTTIARNLASALSGALIDKDTVTKTLVDQLLNALGSNSGDRDSSTYLAQVRPYEYECFVQTLLDCIDVGTTTVATAPFLSEFNNDGWLKDFEHRVMMTNSSTRIVYFWVHCDLEVTKERMLSRNTERDRIKMMVWQEYEVFAQSIRIPGQPVIVLDNSHNDGGQSALADGMRSTLRAAGH
jgi:predicted kinase